jgi:RNA polymerase sigma-70 factor (ECF subfamily)
MSAENPTGAPGVYSPMEASTSTLDALAMEPEPESDLSVEVHTKDFTTFYRDNYLPVARALAYTLGDTGLAAEAADEAMARAYERWSTVQGYDNPGGWVYRVGLNWARSVHRRAARRLPLRDRPVVVQPPVADPAIGEALRALDVKLRAVVVCRLLLDWSVEETADALDVRPGTVKSRLHHALRALESTLGHLR